MKIYDKISSLALRLLWNAWKKCKEVDVCTSNNMALRVIWDKSAEVFNNISVITRAKRGWFEMLLNNRGGFIQNHPKIAMLLLVQIALQ